MGDDGGKSGGEAPRVLNESGPWGKGDPGGDTPGGRRKRPARRRPPPAAPATPSALDRLLRLGRAGLDHRFARPPFGGFGKWIAAALALLWLAGTSVHMIDPAERGVVTRLGRYVGTLEPGLGTSLPWPIDIVHRLNVDRIQSIDVDTDSDGGPGGGQNLMLTGDGNIVDLAFTVRWNVRDPELYLFTLADPGATIRAVAESAMRESVAGASLGQTLASARGEIADRVARRMQELLDRYRAGIAIQGVAIRQADPPTEVLDAFKDVSAAGQEAQSYLNNARAYATQVEANASGEAIAFDQVYRQYKLAPEVTRRRLYYETMEKVLAKTDKTIVEAPGLTPYLPVQPPRAAAKAK